MNKITLSYSNQKDLELLLQLAERIGIFPAEKNNAISDTVIKESNTESFNPKKYYGILSPLKLNIEQELLNMRKEWKRVF